MQEMMKLLKFRVKNFRSVDDSGWIEVDNVTSHKKTLYVSEQESALVQELRHEHRALVG
jgi:hypothetical protein